MSELFHCTVAAVSKDSAKIHVISVHPDSGPPQPEATFAMMLVYDPIMNSGYRDFAKFTHLESCPLAQEMDRDNYLDEGWILKNANAFFSKVTVKKGVLEVFPTHPAWIAHLRKGMDWDTAAYTPGPGDPAEPRAPTPPGEPAAHSRNPADGFRVGTPKYDEYKHLTEAFIAVESPNRYVADPVITGEAEMREATKTMVGQPVLVVPKRGPAEVGTIVKHEPEYVYVYYESPGGGGYGAGSQNFVDLKSIGRAWLKEKTLPTLIAKPAAKKPAAKKNAKPAPKKKKKR